MSIEGDIENPEGKSDPFKYPAFTADHHAVDFLCDYLRMMVGGNLNAFEIENLMDIEMETHHHARPTCLRTWSPRLRTACRLSVSSWR